LPLTMDSSFDCRLPTVDSRLYSSPASIKSIIKRSMVEQDKRHSVVWVGQCVWLEGDITVGKTEGQVIKRLAQRSNALIQPGEYGLR